MNRKELTELIYRKKSFLCVGLDSDITKLPECVLDKEDPIFEFNKAIIDATLPYTVAYKPNLAFYESQGIKGLISLKKTMDYLQQKFLTNLGIWEIIGIGIKTMLICQREQLLQILKICFCTQKCNLKKILFLQIVTKA